MTTTNNNFKDYTYMGSELIKRLNCGDTYRAYIMLLSANGMTSDLTLQQLADHAKESVSSYKKTSKQDSFPNTLRDAGVNVVTKMEASYTSNGSVKRNYYTFKKEDNFRLIGKELFYLDLKNNLKGYLIKLYNIAHTKYNQIRMTPKQISEQTGVSVPTIKKYHSELIDKGLISIDNKAITLNIEAFKVVTNKANKPLTKSNMMLIEEAQKEFNSFKERYAKGLVYEETVKGKLKYLKRQGMSVFTCKIFDAISKDWDGIIDRNKYVESAYLKPVKVYKKKRETDNFILL